MVETQIQNMQNPIENMAENTVLKKKKQKRRKLNTDTLKKMKDTLDANTKSLVQSQNTNKIESHNKAKSVPVEKLKLYPILNDEQLIQKFRSVPMTNNQKGRIRQLLKDSLKGTAECLLPDVIYNRLQTLIKSTNKHTEADLRKIRILYNMLQNAMKHETLKTGKVTKKLTENKTLKKEKKPKEGTNVDVGAQEGDDKKDNENDIEKEKKEQPAQKVKGPKRYVVFVGNLPLDIDKEKIYNHFSEFKNFIKDVRIPKRSEEKKSSIAYVELQDEFSYELALSKHHSMLGNKRINVLYTAQKNGKISKTEAKSKSAKMVALQKSGKLMGSIPLNRKRSQRRMKMKKARAKFAAESS